MEDINKPEFEEPTQSEKELTSWVTDHLERWRDHRDINYLDDWLEYERIFRGKWSAEDKTRESERSRIISPATQQAVETRHAEIVEAIFGQGDFFDIQDDLKDIDGNPLDIEQLKQQMHEDFKRDKVKKSIDHIELLAEIYGTGIGEIVVSTEKQLKPATQKIPGSGVAAIGTNETERTCVKIKPVNPKNFLIDPNADTVDDALGVAIEKYVSIHKVVEGMEKGIYKKVDISVASEDQDLEATQDRTNFEDDKVKLITYYGLVPRELLLNESEGSELADLFPDDSIADEYSDLVEAIIVIANDSVLLKAEENPYMMKDRPVVAYQDDTVPGRFWGRGTVEKAYNMQKAIDGQLRAHMDSLALTTAPMIAMDATRLPRGAKFEIKPGKAILTNGAPSEILYPFKFGQTDGNAMAASQNFERMLLQATGTVDSAGMPSNIPRDAGTGGMSMAMAGIIKKYKRTLSNFQEDFMIPFIYKAAYRFMQFDSERYPSVDMVFIPTATLGIIAREHEQQQMIGLLQTLGPNTPVLPLLLRGILSNSSLSNRGELMDALAKMSQPDPQAQQTQQMQQQLAMQSAQAGLAVQTAQAQKYQAEAQQTMVETQMLPEKMKIDIIQSAATNLDNGGDFEKRLKLADMMLKEKQINLKAADISSNERIATLQMMNKQK